MKKSFIIIFTVTIFAFQTNIYGQNLKSTVSMNAGISLAGTLIKTGIYLLDGYNENDIVDYKSIPVINGAYDYMINDWLSAGIAGGYQSFDFTFQEGDINLSRMNIAARALFHYGKSDKLDMYSGIRLGATIWNSEMIWNTSDPTLESFFNDEYVGSFFRTQLVAFGIRGYFTDNIGANIEFAIGSPYYLSGGVNFRF